ncbi:hypothetical protein ACFL0V_03935 [Nanoarchaeota archaeon]
MERKLVKQGRNALTVTLPAKWLKVRGLLAGDVVQMAERNKDILVSASVRRAKSSVVLDLVGENRSTMFHSVLGKYMQGYDLIEVMHDSPKDAQDLVQMCFGMIIESHTSKRTVLKSVIAVPEEEFETVLRRSAHMLLETAKMLPDVVTGRKTRKDLIDQERLLDYNLLFCLRYLNKYSTDEKAYKYFLLCATLESAGDQLKDLAKYIGKDKKLAEAVVNGVSDYSSLLFKGDLKRMVRVLRAFRNSMGRRTFAEGIAYSLAENLYNYVGYVVGEE